MIVRVLLGSLLFVLVIFPPNGPFATRIDGNTDNSSAQLTNTSVLNQSNADNTTATFVSSFNQTGIALENGGIPRTGGEEERTDPNVRDDSNKRTEDKDSTKRSNMKNSHARDIDIRHGSTREDDVTTAFLMTSSLLRQQDLETSHDESTSAADQDLTGKPRELHTSYSSVTLNSPSVPFKKISTDRTTSSRGYTGSFGENFLENEDTHSSRKAAGMTVASPAGKLTKRTGTKHDVLLSTAAPAVDSATPDFKTETKVNHTSGTAADDQMAQTDDVRNRKRDVNATRLEVTKSEFAYKSLWDDADMEDDEGKMEADRGVGRGGTTRKRITGGAAEEAGGTGKRVDGKREEDGRFTIPAELRKARNRNGQLCLFV